MSSVEELKHRVGAAVAQTEQAMLQLHGVAVQLDEAVGMLRLTAIGSVHPTLIDAVNKLQQSRDRLEEAQTIARGAIADAQAWQSLA